MLCGMISGGLCIDIYAQQISPIQLESTSVPPDLDAEAWLDLAILHMKQGEEAKAILALEQVEALGDPPPAAAAVMAQLRSMLTGSSFYQRRQWLRVGASLGYTDNANQGVLVNNIRLPGVFSGTELILDNNLKARGDSFFEIWGNVLQRWSWPERRWNVWGSLRGRAYNRESDFDLLHGSAGASHEMGVTMLPRGVADIGGSVQDTRLGGRHLSQTERLFTKVSSAPWQALPDLRVDSRFQLERRHYPSTPIYDGIVRDFSLGIELLYTNDVPARWEVGWQKDLSLQGRPGGDAVVRYHQLMVHSGGEHPVLESLFRYEHLQQQEPYSAALLGDYQRAEYRQLWQVSWRLPIGSVRRWHLLLQSERVRANLALFDNRRHELRLEWYFN